MFRFFKDLKMSQKLILAFTVLVLLPVVIISWISVRNVSSRIEENMRNRVFRTLTISQNVFQNNLKTALEDAKNTAQLPSVQENVKIAQAQDVSRKQHNESILNLITFVNVRSSQLNATTLEIADKKGEIVAKSYKVLVEDDNPVLDPRQYLTEPHADKVLEAINYRELNSLNATKEGIILKGYAPIRTYDEPYGVIVIGYAVDEAMVDDVSEIVGKNTQVSVFLRDKLIASSFPDSLIPEVVKHGDIFYKQIEEPGNPILRVVKIGEESYLNGHQLIFDDVGEFIGMITASVPYGEVVAVKRLSVRLILVSAFLALLLSVLFGIRLARLITNPVGKLVNGARAVSAGDFSHRIEVESRDEIGILGVAFNQMTRDIEDLIGSLERLNQVGIALSREHDLNKLLSIILKEARELTYADAGNIYVLRKDKLNFEISQYETLDRMYSDSTKYFQAKELPVSKDTIPGYVAKTGETLNIEDVYEIPSDSEYDFDKSFDEQHQYRTKSMLAVPMLDKDEVIGVLQLMNVRQNGDIIPFGTENTQVATSLASQAAVAIKSSELDKAAMIGSFDDDNENLANSLASQAAVAIKNADLLKEITSLLYSVVQFSSYLIDARSKHTAGHSRRVHDYAMAIAHTVNETDEGKWRDYHFSREQLEELSIAGWLHDIGKVSIPERILDKANKLSDEAMDAINMRFQYIEQWYKLLKCRHKGDGNGDGGNEAQELHETVNDIEEMIQKVRDDYKFIEAANVPGVTPVMTEEKLQRLKEIANRYYYDIHNHKHSFLSEFEVKNLSVSKGSLTDEEREIIKNHIVHTIRILNTIPFPKKWKNVPYIAGAHHEKLNGAGYPNGLTAEDLNTQCRILAIADIFDALTSSDRPYKKAKTVEQTFDILEKFFVGHDELDADLVALFKESKCYEPILEEAKSAKDKENYNLFNYQEN